MDSITTPRGIGVERFFARALRMAPTLASVAVLGFMLFGPGAKSAAILPILAIFTIGFGAISMFKNFWDILVDGTTHFRSVLSSAALALSITATMLVGVQNSLQGWIYGSLLLLLFLSAVALNFHADLREERASGRSLETASEAEVEPALALEFADGIQQPMVTADSGIRERLESSLPLLKHTP